LALFDFRLRNNFWHAANLGKNYPLPDIFNNTLVMSNPVNAVTFVDNHDLQPYRNYAMDFRYNEHDWFKPLAYALILLRPFGYPCVFFGDYFPSDLYKWGVMDRHGWIIERFMEARKLAVGEIIDQKFDHPNCIGWLSKGKSKSMVVVMSNGSDGWKEFNTRMPNKTFYDITRHFDFPIVTDNWGNARFLSKGGKVSVWLEQ